LNAKRLGAGGRKMEDIDHSFAMQH